MIGPVAGRLLEHLRADGRTVLPQNALHGAFAQADPGSAGTVHARRRLAEALEELVAAGELTATKVTDDGAPPLPRRVKVVRAPTPVRPPRDTRPWHPELNWAAELPNPSPVLRQVSDWLFGGGTHAAEAPLRERALEITGDEKAFDGRLPGRLTPETLRARRVRLPLHREPVGAGPVLLVVENADTFHSLLAALRVDPGPVGAVGWGAGNGFASSVLSLADDPPGTIRYFGDLDPAGLRIPARASAAAEAEGVGPVRPATGLYRALLEHGRPAAVPVVDHSDVDWLDPGLRGPVRDLFAGGHRLAQEAVGQRVLAGDDGWRDGLGPG
ncbi:hypothetical protein ACLFMI_07655 [Pseudonocardia nantongensis]|uniref:hypothetical protein n=1 Tax=Pseudonocardia nantongensis TaxID=1181885 RepID=UPI00397D5242